ncbi:MAG: hypothetical protein JWO30_2142, partial [Fibrobacteres bacterium]|nr:hypothetical protein [Fibrobacterota bacterium]
RSCAPEIGTEKLGTGVFAVLWVWLGLFFWSGGWAEESDFNGAEGEAGAYGRLLKENPPKPVRGDSVRKAGARRGREKKAAAVGTKGSVVAGGADSLGLKPDSVHAESVNVDSASSKSAAGGVRGSVADSVGSHGKGEADWNAPGIGKLAGPGAIDTAAAADTVVGSEAEPAETLAPGVPDLVLLPMVASKGRSGERGDFEKAEAALRLGLVQSGRFRVLTEEEAARIYGGGEKPPRECFSERCLGMTARKLGKVLVVASQYSVRDSVKMLKVVLAEAPEGKIRKATQVWGRPGQEGMIPFALETAMGLAVPDWGRDRAPDTMARVDGAFFASRPWRDIPWLNPRDTADNRHRWGWAGTGVLIGGLGLAYAQGQLLQSDGNHTDMTGDVLSGAGAQSFLRGFFAAPTLGARYAAMGGAGIAQVNNGLALLMNPAGVADADRENVVAAKRSLPDGTPSFFLGYAGPLYRHWAQGLGVQFEGDRLANETTLHGALGYDLGALGKDLVGVKAGAQTKIYLAQVGEGGVGEDRSTGRSFGMGLDLGIQARLNEKITAALAVRDAASFLRHSNTLTNQSYAEVLPTEYRLGAAYRASRSLLLLMDGQKAMWADQADHLRLGGEQVLFEFLALRCGLHEIFGREAVRKMSVGFGLDTDGLGDKSLKIKIALNYAYEFGLSEDQPLGGGQQFSLEASF